jgi:hypothetical protein
MPNRNDQLFKGQQTWPKAFTANGSLSKNDTYTCCTNLGAAGTVTITLPQAAPGDGPFYFFVAAGTKTLSVKPALADAIRGKAANATISSSTLASFLKLQCIVAGTWEIEVNVGTWV